MFNFFKKTAVKKVNVPMYRIIYKDGTEIMMDAAGVNMAVVHDYDEQIKKVLKIEKRG